MSLRKQCLAVTGLTVLIVLGVIPPPPAAGEDDDKQPRITVKERTVAIGRLKEGERGMAKFVLENGGTADLHIESVSASCGCTVPRGLTPAQKIIAPGESREIEAVFNSQGRRGKQRKSVTVKSDDPLEPRLQLFLTADVVTLFEMLIDGRQNRRLSFGKLSPGKPIEKTIEILPTEPNETLEIDSIEVRDASLVYTVEPLTKDDRNGVIVKLSIDPSASLKQVSTSLIVDARIGDQKSQSNLAIMGEVIGILNYRPTTIKRMQPVLPGNSLPPLTVSSNGMVPFEILGVESGDRIETRVEQRTPSHYRVDLKISETAPPGPFGTFLDVRTNLVDQPLVRVPLYASVLPLVTVEPPMVFLRGGGAEDSVRTVKVEASSGETLEIAKLTSGQPFLTARIVASPGRKSTAMKHVSIEVNGDAPPGTHTTFVRLQTNLEGEPEAMIPVTVLVQ